MAAAPPGSDYYYYYSPPTLVLCNAFVSTSGILSLILLSAVLTDHSVSEKVQASVGVVLFSRGGGIYHNDCTVQCLAQPHWPMTPGHFSA